MDTTQVLHLYWELVKWDVRQKNSCQNYGAQFIQLRTVNEEETKAVVLVGMGGGVVVNTVHTLCCCLCIIST